MVALASFLDSVINSKIKMEDIYKNTQDLDENVNQS
jgi:hypothetical protein